MRTGLDSMMPDNSRSRINMHYQSETTGEFGTLRLSKAMSIDDILRQYSTLFPIEMNAFLEDIKEANQLLLRPGGMSKEGVVMAIGKIPKVIFLALEFLDPDFWLSISNFRRFIRSYPKFAVGNHSKKYHSGAIHAR